MIRKMKPFAWTVSAALLLADPSAAADFQSPSGNIQCYLQRPVNGDLICLIFEANWPKPDLAEPCNLDETRAVILGPQGNATAETMCHGDLFWPYPSGAVSYGATWRVKEFSCDIATTGVTCRNGTGHGFRVRKSSLDILAP